MEEIIGLLVVLAIGIFKAVNKKFENAGKEKEVSMPEAEPVVIRQEPVVPKKRPMVPKQKPSAIEVVESQTKVRKPMLIEEEENGPKEEIDPKKLVLYSEIRNPKFSE